MIHPIDYLVWRGYHHYGNLLDATRFPIGVGIMCVISALIPLVDIAESETQFWIIFAGIVAVGCLLFYLADKHYTRERILSLGSKYEGKKLNEFPLGWLYIAYGAVCILLIGLMLTFEKLE